MHKEFSFDGEDEGEAQSSSVTGENKSLDSDVSSASPASFSQTRGFQGFTDEEIGRIIVERMTAEKYHPVLLFGAAYSGKSALLGSLFSYLKLDGSTGIQIQIGEQLVNAGHYRSDDYELAKNFFDRVVQNFVDGRAMVSTEIKRAFFIPVIITRKDGSQVKYAFLESNGEWYDPQDEGALFRPIRAEIASVLKHYPYGMSVLYFAPYTQLEAFTQNPDRQRDAELRKKADLALVGTMEAYKDLRSTKGSDAHMFLITKWDVCAPPGDPDGAFRAPNLQQVTDVAKSRFSQSFATFSNLALRTTEQKQVMQYSAGQIAGAQIIAADEQQRVVFQRYPRVLWDWLTINASGRPLFPIQQQKPLTISERWNAGVRSFLKKIGV